MFNGNFTHEETESQTPYFKWMERSRGCRSQPDLQWSMLVTDPAFSWTTPDHQTLCDQESLPGMPDWCPGYHGHLGFWLMHLLHLPPPFWVWAQFQPFFLSLRLGDSGMVCLISAFFQSFFLLSPDSWLFTLAWHTPAPRHLVGFNWSAGHISI